MDKWAHYLHLGAPRLRWQTTSGVQRGNLKTNNFVDNWLLVTVGISHPKNLFIRKLPCRLHSRCKNRYSFNWMYYVSHFTARCSKWSYELSDKHDSLCIDETRQYKPLRKLSTKHHCWSTGVGYNACRKLVSNSQLRLYHTWDIHVRMSIIASQIEGNSTICSLLRTL